MVIINIKINLTALTLLNFPSLSQTVLPNPNCLLGMVTALVTSQTEPRNGLELWLRPQGSWGLGYQCNHLMAEFL